MSEEKKSPSILSKLTFAVFTVLVACNLLLKVFPNEIKEPEELSKPSVRMAALMKARIHYLKTKPDTINYTRSLAVDEIKSINAAIEKINEVKANDVMPYVEGQSYQEFDIEVRAAILEEIIELSNKSDKSYSLSTSRYRSYWLKKYGYLIVIYIAAFWGFLLLLNLIKLVRKMLRDVKAPTLD